MTERRRQVANLGLAATALAVIAMPAALEARTGDALREGARNGTAFRETQIISAVEGNSFATRQSNVSAGRDAGGAAIYGCRRPAAECTRHVNLSTGPAAAFTTKGLVPFTVDQPGLVRNLNADLLDGSDKAQIVEEARRGKVEAASHADAAGRADSAGTAQSAQHAITAGRSDTAGHADSAAVAQSAKRAESVDGVAPATRMRFVSSSASGADLFASLAQAERVGLAELGPFRLYGKCITSEPQGDVAPKTFAAAFVETTDGPAMVDSPQSDLLGTPSFLQPGQPEDERILQFTGAGPDAAAYDAGREAVGLVAGDGIVFQLLLHLAAKHGTPPGGDGPFGGPGNRCGFAVTVLGGASVTLRQPTPRFRARR